MDIRQTLLLLEDDSQRCSVTGVSEQSIVAGRTEVGLRARANDGGAVALERAARQVQEVGRAYVDGGRIVVDHDVVETSGGTTRAGDADADRRAEIDHGVAHADEGIVTDEQSGRQSFKTDAVENSGDETNGRLRGDTVDCAGFDVGIFDEQVTGSGGKVNENAVAVTGGVVSLTVDVAVLDVQSFTGEPANSIEARAGAVDGNITEIDHIICSGVNDDTGCTSIENSGERAVAVERDGLGNRHHTETARVEN